jgi:hypothetical protein
VRRARRAAGARSSRLLTLAVWPATGLFLRAYTDTDVPWWDAFPTAPACSASGCSAASTIENWPTWVVVNVVSVGPVRLQGPVAHGHPLRRLHRHERDRLARVEATMSRLVALLGAECTGKSTLAEALAARFNAGLVSEYLREWCDAHGRTPLQHEQAHIATEQAARIDAAVGRHELVVCDTTPLITALCSQHYFNDDSLLAQGRWPFSAAAT